ncbi:MAG: hypothetical protein V4772_25020 [Pseudomonadota bacterium]
MDDELLSVWESLWDERGTPLPLFRWDQDLTYRISGVGMSRHRETIVRALEAVAEASKIRMTDLASMPDEGKTAMLEIEVVEERDLPENQACSTRLSSRSGGVLAKVEVKLKSRQVWSCVMHEAMHAMGIAGHPSGNTVLSYFTHRRDQLTELDKLMLGVWYSKKLAPGNSPFEVLAEMTDAVAVQRGADIGMEAAQQRAHAFMRAALLDMEKFAEGSGEVPVIIKRSGRASSNHMDEARLQIGWFLARAYQNGTIAEKSRSNASRWFKAGAEKGHLSSQVAWGLALARGTGVERDQAAACTWYARAAPALTHIEAKELRTLELTLCPPAIEAPEPAPQASGALP